MITYRCQLCRRESTGGPGTELPRDRCPKAGPKGWHRWRRVPRPHRAWGTYR